MAKKKASKASTRKTMPKAATSKRGVKKPASKATPRKTASARSSSNPRPRSTSSAADAVQDSMPGFEVVQTSRARPRANAQVVQSAPISKQRSKFGLRPNAAPNTANTRHGQIVRVRPAGNSANPADETLERAVYIDPDGQVEFMQG
jgi:hypothetical protein